MFRDGAVSKLLYIFLLQVLLFSFHSGKMELLSWWCLFFLSCQSPIQAGLSSEVVLYRAYLSLVAALSVILSWAGSSSCSVASYFSFRVILPAWRVASSSPAHIFHADALLCNGHANSLSLLNLLVSLQLVPVIFPIWLHINCKLILSCMDSFKWSPLTTIGLCFANYSVGLC